ncbi:MAG TPA: hypothetical protein VIL97_07755 [Thermoanaerobaculia bacterium]
MVGILSAAITVLAIVALFAVAVEVFVGWLEQHGRRVVSCPETGEDAMIELDAFRNAIPLALQKKPKLTIKRCSLWTERQTCDQRCLAEPNGK